MDNDSESASSLFPDNLSGDAYRTFLSYTHSSKAGTDNIPSDEIPSVYWADHIKRLNPIKVYIHRINIVVVQRSSDDIEEGKYIYIPISSYFPCTGDDGFMFYPDPMGEDTHTLGKDVYDFKRPK